MSSEIEILTRKISAAKEVTSEIIDAMNGLAALQLESDITGAIETSKRAIAEARAIEYSKGEAMALMQAGMGVSKQRNYQQACEYYEQALHIREKLRDQEGVAISQWRLGNAKLFDGKYPQALEHYSRAIEIRTMLGDDLGTADLYTNSGAIYGLLGNYAQALKSHMQALKIFERFNELPRLASTCSNIGVIYYDLHDYDDALKMYQRALEIRKKITNLKEESLIMNNIGLVYHDQHRYTEAKEMHEHALQLRNEIGDKSKIAISLSNLGDVYKALKQHGLSLDYYSRSLSIFEELNEKRGLVPVYYNIGELHFMLGEFKEARHFLTDAIKLAEEIGVKDHLREAYEYIAKIYARDENYKEAYRFHTRVTELDREISNNETSRVIAQISMRHEIEQQERNAELERTKNIELTKAYNSLEEEKKRSEALLLNILPVEVSEELKQFGKTKARSYEMATVMFADIKGFTIISEQLSAEELVTGIDEYFEEFDKIVEKHGIEKIKTIGDAYLCAGGVPVAQADHAEKVVAVAKDFMKAADELRKKRAAAYLHTFDFRIGIHSGPVVAGVVGIMKFAYDIWGDTVNTASRMQQNSEPHRINISESTYQLVKEKFSCEFRGEIEAKNKGKLKMYFVE